MVQRILPLPELHVLLGGGVAGCGVWCGKAVSMAIYDHQKDTVRLNFYTGAR